MNLRDHDFYTTVGVSDLALSTRFYDTVFATLGIRRTPGAEAGFVGWGPSYDDGVSFWICKPFDGNAPSPGNGTMVAFRARNAAEVRSFHAAALANGGTNEGAPGTREHTGRRSTSPMCGTPTATSSPAASIATTYGKTAEVHRAWPPLVP